MNGFDAQRFRMFHRDIVLISFVLVKSAGILLECASIKGPESRSFKKERERG